MKKEQFLNFIEKLIIEKDIIYHDEKENFFYFYYENLQFNIGSNASSSYFSITDTKVKNKTETFQLTYDETIKLIELSLEKIPTNNNSYQDKVEDKDLNSVFLIMCKSPKSSVVLCCLWL